MATDLSADCCPLDEHRIVGSYERYWASGPYYKEEPFMSLGEAAFAWLQWVTHRKKPTENDALVWLARLKLS